MANSFEEIALDQSVVRKQWLPLDVAVREVLAFEKLFGTGHFLLACHAALPSLLTPELLHFVRLNFLDQQKTPWIAEMDFLLSPLCRPLERDLFEVEPMVREALLFKLEERYGWQHLQNVADFLLQYVHKHRTIKQNAGVTQLHEWIAQAYLQPDKIVQELTRLLNESVDPQSNDYKTLPKKLRVARSMELLADPLRRTTLQEEYAGLVHSARVLAYMLYSNKETFPTRIRTAVQGDVLLTFKEAMSYLRVSRSILYRLMWSGQLRGHKVGSTWRFYLEDLLACANRETPLTIHTAESASASERSSALFPSAVQQWLSTITTSQTSPKMERASTENVDTFNEVTEVEANNGVDIMLSLAGWIVQDNDAVNVNAARGIAIREFPSSEGFLDYLLVVDGEAAGVIDVKKSNIELSGIQEQLAHYQKSLARIQSFPPIMFIRSPLSFAYATNGFDIIFTNESEPETRSRHVFHFHQPETLAIWLKQAPEGTPNDLNDLLRSRLRRIPPIVQSEMVSQVQLEAVSAIEKSLATNHSRALIQIPNGRGKTESLVYLAFRLLKFAHARRILYLVDNESIVPRIYHRLEQAIPLYTEDVPIEQFNIQLLQNSSIDSAARICISNIEHFYSVFSGIQIVDEWHRLGSPFSPEIRYNPSIPIEFFDVILIYDCASDTYRQWRPLLEYFDAFIIGATESVDRQIHSFFHENLVYDYNKKYAISLIVEKCYNKFRGHVSNEDYIEQITYLLFLKIAGTRMHSPYNEQLHIPPGYDWKSLQDSNFDGIGIHYSHILETLSTKEDLTGIIFRKATNKIQNPASLHLMVKLIDEEIWPNLNIDELGDIYERLLEIHAENNKKYVAPFFTPHALTQTVVDVMHPELGMMICDPACGTGSFLTAAYRYINQDNLLTREETTFLRDRTFYGWERDENMAKLCAMNLYSHNILPIDANSPVTIQDSLQIPINRQFDMVLMNPPFGFRSNAVYERKDFWAGTRDGDFAYIQLAYSLLKAYGRAAIVVPNGVLFRGGVGQEVRRRLLEDCDLHTILMLPANVFYETSIPTAILFFDNIPPNDRPGTKELWIYDLRTNQHFTRRKNPLRREHLEDFVRCYNPENRHERKETERFHKFTYEELIKRDKCDLNITWLDAADQKPSEPISETVNRRFTLWLASQEHTYPKPFTDEQILWLERIRDQIATNGKFEEQDFNRSPFEFDGGLAAARFLFGKELATILRELNELALPNIHQKTIAEWLEEGIVYLDSKQYEKAVAAYDQVLRLNPNSATAYHGRGNAYTRLMQYGKAIADYDQAIRLKPNDAHTYLDRGTAYFHLKRYINTITDYDQAIRLDPNSATAYYGRGNAYTHLMQYDKAIADYDQAIRLDPNSATAYYDRGSVYHRLNQYEKAIADYDEAIRLSPNDTRAKHNRDEAYQLLE